MKIKGLNWINNLVKLSIKYTARSNKKHKLTLSINASIDGKSYLDFTEFLESNENLENDYLEHEEVVELQKIISHLEPDEFELIFLVYYNNFSLKDYAEKKKLPYSQIVRKKNAILNKIKSKLSNDSLIS